MIKFVKFVDVTDSINACNHCHYGCNGTRDANNCGHWSECGGGYFINQLPKPKRTRPRKSRDRRLLEALLSAVVVDAMGYVNGNCNGVSKTIGSQLVAIKQAMEKKGSGK
jgi:hypothetical protein